MNIFPGRKHKPRLCVRSCTTGKLQWLQTQSFSSRRLGPPLLSLRQDLAAGWYSQRRLLTTRELYPGRPETAAVRQSYFACLWRASAKRHTCIRPASDRGDARNARSPNSSRGSHACCTCFRAGPEDGRAKLESRAPQASGAQGEEGRCSKSQTRDEGTDPTSVKRHGLWRRRSPFLRKLANGFQSEERSVLAAIVA